MKEKLVLIGNGMAGMRALEELFKHNTSMRRAVISMILPSSVLSRILIIIE